MFWTFARGASSTTVDLNGRVTWRTPAGGNAGEASVFIPHGNAAASSTYINPDGGSLLTVPSQGGAGIWRGIVTKVDIGSRGATITAHQPWLLLSQRNVRGGLTVSHVTAGYIAGLALSDGLAGIGGLYPGAASYESAGPHVESYAFNRQSAWSVLTDMMNRSEGELHVNTETGRCDWVGPFTAAQPYPGLLVAGPDIRDVTVSKELTTRVSEVTATHDGDWYSAYDADAAAGQNWPAQATVTAPSGGLGLTNAAASALAGANTPMRFIDGGVTEEHWSIRERDYIRVLVPWLDFTGGVVAGRVLERTVDAQSALMRVKIQIVNNDRSYPYTSNAARQQAAGRSRNSVQAIAGLPSLRQAIEALRS